MGGPRVSNLLSISTAHWAALSDKLASVHCVNRLHAALVCAMHLYVNIYVGL